MHRGHQEWEIFLNSAGISAITSTEIELPELTEHLLTQVFSEQI